MPTATPLRQQFDIPAQSLRGALIALATQADISIGLTNIDITNLTSRAVSEYGSVGEALGRLLAGTELTFEMVDSTTYRIFPRSNASASSSRAQVVALASSPIDEITITASKRPLALQASPNSVAAITNKTISEYAVQSAKDITSFVAGFTATNQGPGRNKYIIRGLADGPFIGNTQSTVGVYIDETRAIFNAPDPNLQLFDVDRVEVLRGPQGTLYGAGSIAGLVRIVTHQPDLGKFETYLAADGNVGAGTNSSGTAEAMVNVPLLDDRLALRTVAYTRHNGGYIDNTLLEEKRTNDSNIKGFRTNTRLRLSPDWTVTAGITYQTIRAHDTQYFNASLAPFTRRNLLNEPSKSDFLDANCTINGDLGWADLISSTAWLVQHVSSRFDASLALPVLLRVPPSPTAFDQASRYHTINHETRLVSSTPSDVQWIAGVFTSFRWDSSNTTLKLLSTRPPDVFYIKNRRDTGTELSAFGEVNYAVSSRFSIDAGLRVYRGTVDVTANNTGAIDVGPLEAIGQNKKLGFTPKIEVAYKLGASDLIYAEAAQGYRLGGVNIASPLTRVPVPGRRPLTVSNFDSDRLWNFEIGLKESFLDRRLLLNATTFYAIWKDIQADLVRLNGLSFTANLGNSDIKGFELESWFAPNDHVLLSANLSWNDVGARNGGDVQPTSVTVRLPAVPKLRGALAVQYQTDLSDDVTGFVNIKYDFVGDAKLSVGSLPMSEVPAYHVVGIRGGVEHGHWKFAAYLNNVTNNSTNTYAFGNPFALGRFAQVIPLRPRVFGVAVSWAN